MTTQPYTYAVQIIDPQHGHTDWTVTPPVQQTDQDAGVSADEVAKWIADRKQIGFLASVRGRVAVWVGDREHGTFGEGLGEPDGTYEVTKEN